MKPEALNAFATQCVRPEALEAAAAEQTGDKEKASNEGNANREASLPIEPIRPALNRLNTPFGQRTDGTETTAKAVEGVVEGVKAAVHEAVVWTERKAEQLAHTQDHAGPYDSPATAAGGVSDLDVIATGVLPATVPVQEDGVSKGDGSQRSEGSGRSGR